jgi:hypothetical protein
MLKQADQTLLLRSVILLNLNAGVPFMFALFFSDISFIVIFFILLIFEFFFSDFSQKGLNGL